MKSFLFAAFLVVAALIRAGVPALPVLAGAAIAGVGGAWLKRKL